MGTKFNLCDFILFGGHGDLAFRKLMPALYHLCKDDYISEDTRIITVSRRNITIEEHIELVKSKLLEYIDDFDEEFFSKFKNQIYLVNIDLNQNQTFENLKNILDEYPNRHRINYLSTSPDFFGQICQSLSYWKIITDNSRVVLEKPLGRDLKSSQELNKKVLNYFKENQIYRIDHYLGKDTVQNILALRFSNIFFLPLWNANHIDHIQITVAESVGVEGRWDYYDEYGALRDMIQNHLMQLLCLIAMEPPCSIDANSIRDEKVKVLRSFRKMKDEDIKEKTVRAQYKAGSSEGESVPGYIEEDSKQSDTETFAAIRIDIDNWRWNNVPFYIRSGKRMQKRNSEIVIQFKSIPHSIFSVDESIISANRLVITLQPNESIELKLMNKIPGLSESMELQQVDLELNSPLKVQRKPDAYERLILDVIRANATLFMRLDEVEEAWKWADTILEGWQKNLTPMKKYTAGSDGPSAAIQIIAKDGRSWNDE
ncbi:glucose-6-phosphate dehydrogenase [Arcobacter sp. LA11]|uniref:glucose-6-phosphate dehydrogenase n=1 Tax=Arcobacter sp. LA11 TaxID=1898176 RepID=UPI0009326ED2|nr:glucose-6-phosphate dehydrogenase [Arcobacter sp. LA11]